MQRAALTTIAIWLVAATTAVAADSRPNVVLLLADDVGCDAIGCYGGASYPAPNIDRLAATGMRFTHCYSMPSCHPSRITLLTGRYPRRLGRPKWGTFPAEEEPRTLAQVVHAAGYPTAVAGKWQLSLLGRDLEQPRRMGFGQYSLFGWHEGPRYYEPLIYENGRRRDDVKDRYGPDVYSDVLIDFIGRNKAQPFFAYFPMALCHDVTDDLDEPVPYGPHGRYDNYRDMMAQLDRVVGKVVDAIDEAGIRERTLILFTGDNGTAARSIVRAEGGKYIRQDVFSLYNGNRVQGGKTRLTNGGTHVPLIANWQGVVGADQVTDDLVDFSDFLPTLAELTGGQLPAGVTLDGHSFAGRLTRNAPTARRWAYAEAGKKFWVRDQRRKLYNDGRYFNMAADPFEKRPLDINTLSAADAAAYRHLKAALQSVTAFD